MTSPYNRTRSHQVVRILRLLAHLELEWQSLAVLSERLKVSLRTVQRDLAAIEYAGLPLRRGRRGNTAFWRMARRLP
jgi:predicted DNA-binding transcriptional regulator YafY